LVQFKRGDHICLFYRDEKSLLETVAAYIIAGIQKGERCFCAQKSHIIPKLRDALRALGLEVEGAIAGGALEIRSEDDVYFSDGRFRSEVMMALLETSIDEARRNGFTGFRTAGEMSWALERQLPNGGNYCDQLVGYEQMVQAAFPDKGAIGICQYPIHRFPAKTLDAVLNAHRFSLEETMISSNHSTLTLRAGEFLADIVADRLNPGSAYHYVVQKRGAREVLSWGVEPTIENALAVSDSILTDLQRPYQKQHSG
jgi:hypothetical protein